MPSDAADSGDHVGDSAQLYALGALEPGERARVDAHVERCAACARALGAAEATVVALADAFAAHVEPPEDLTSRIASAAASRRGAVAPSTPATNARTTWNPSRLVAAAAVALALGIGAAAITEHRADVRQAERESAVLATIANSHFLHVGLAARTPRAPVAKVLYARDGAWTYIIVDRATCECHVVMRSVTGARDLGAPEARGTTATLFVRDIPHPTSLALIDDAGRVIADATFVYPKSPQRRLRLQRGNERLR